MRFLRALLLFAVSTALIIGVVAVAVYVSWLLALVVGSVYPVVMILGFIRMRGTGGEAGPKAHEYEKTLGLIVGLAGFAAFVSGVTAWNNLVLSASPDVTAVVVHEKFEKPIGRGRGHWAFTLAPVSPAHPGETLPGGPLERGSHQYFLLDRITVRVDPSGYIAPKVPAEAESPVGLLCFLGFTAPIAGVILWSLRTGGPPRPPVRSEPVN
ncbi:ABC transporter ATP-binding protein [Streptomyces sp. NRRL WC-3742]|uniref:ABC transporter ATP-binding protein n=1 Tax=Streptomyces sp. NRRL WC-3742 TaxID=1463934 RepID=UPI0004C5669A|nr:ABC transporter ATP-binding protein [Streptomyces sp. NRRL WC-3742]